MSTNPGTTPRSVGESLKSAGTLVALQAERTKLVQITLPNAYVELGKVIFRDGSRRPEFENLFAELDRLDAEKKKVKSGAEGRPASQSFGDRAKSLYAGAKDIAVTKTLDLRLRSVAITLGEAVYAKHGMNAGEHSLVQPIADALERVAKVDADISGEARGLGSEFASDSSRLASNVKSWSLGSVTLLGRLFAPRRLLAVGAGIAVVALVVSCLYLAVLFVGSARKYVGAHAEKARAENQENTASMPAGSRVVKVAIKHPPKVSSSFQFEVPEQNKHLSDMKCYATEGGDLIFTFKMAGWHTSAGFQGWPMIVRLFDKNGNYLTHFITQRFALEGMMQEPVRTYKKVGELVRGINTLSFPLNMRDLRETEYVEISFLDTAVWAEKW